VAVLRVGILISGRGSNLQALIDATQKAGFPATIICVISNDATAGGLAKAKAANIPTHVISHYDFKDRASFEQAIDAKLTECGVQLICLAGFMRMLTSWFVERWLDRLINIHPSLLPAFAGLDVHQRAIDHGVKFSGCTVHFVRAELDHGPIILQAVVPVLPDDSEETLAARVLETEHKIYPQAVRFIAENRVNVMDERVFITGVATPPETLISPIDGLAKS